MGKEYITKSNIRVEYIDSINKFSKYAEKIDEIFIKLYGDKYPHLLINSIQKIGPDSRAIGVWFGDKLIGYTGFIQDKKHNRVEFGRLFKHPDYDFNIMVMDEFLNRAIEEFHTDKEKILFGTTRLWISSAYMELLGFTLCGSYVLPIPIQSTWGGNTCYPYFGVYNFPLEERIKKTCKIPEWIRKLFPKWNELFNIFSNGPEPINLKLECEEEPFIPENRQKNIEQKKLVYIPCVNNNSIIQYTNDLIKDGYTIFSIFPSWLKIEENNINNNNNKNNKNNENLKIFYVSVILLGNINNMIENYPKNFALSAIHYDFVKDHFCNEEGLDIIYKKPMNELFRRRPMGFLKKLLIKFIDRFYQVKIYSLFNEYSVEKSLSNIFG